MDTIRRESESEADLHADDLQETWRLLSAEDRIEAFLDLPRAEAEDFFLDLSARDEYELLSAMPAAQRRSWMRLLPPDDAADVVQESEDQEKAELLALLDDATRLEVQALLAYKEDEAGGLMNPRYARLRPDASVDEAIAYLRRQAREVLEHINYVYVLETDQRLLGVVSFRDLLSAPAGKTVREMMVTDVVTADENLPQEDLGRLFAQHDLQSIPVVDAAGHMKGIVTIDDIVDVIQEEATEDIQKLGGTQALDAPYLEVGFREMLGKRVVWLAVLFVGELLTASAMGRFEHELGKALILSLFIPLIISSGGNSGSQATTLVIRAMALGEVTLSDWWRVAHREIAQGVTTGFLLGLLGFGRVVLWERLFHVYGEHSMLLGVTICFSVMGVVLTGTLAGSMLPFLLKRAGLDPASASAPFVATLVDVTGIILYFSIASLVLRGTLL